ncbi:hypothetical protein JOB18_048657 [Solea senegalensis]|uniref:Uncharacterized protein n=1 Tax=Solea senegalensis TaxID=28829 RepID=A0AAV6PD89_SOLSE|nr:hypothetical protein JOB18_048657 [Solea senegalensis]
MFAELTRQELCHMGETANVFKLGKLDAAWASSSFCFERLLWSTEELAGRASQHGAPAVCLICHRSVDIQLLKIQRRNGANAERVRVNERRGESIYKRLSKLPEASGHIICFLSLSLSALFLPLPETINGVPKQTSPVLF